MGNGKRIVLILAVGYGMFLMAGSPTHAAESATPATDAVHGETLTPATEFMIEPTTFEQARHERHLMDANAWRDAFYQHIPEPASAVLLMLGAFMIFHGSRRRSQHNQEAEPAQG